MTNRDKVCIIANVTAVVYSAGRLTTEHLYRQLSFLTTPEIVWGLNELVDTCQVSVGDDAVVTWTGVQFGR